MSKQKSAVIYCAFPPVRGVYIEVSKTKGQKQHEKTRVGNTKRSEKLAKAKNKSV